jgi:hypothetical protein
MTMTRPWRLMTLQLSHIVLTLARTFTVASFLFVRSVPLLVAVGDATSFEVVRSELYLDAIAWENTDVVHPHLARDMGKYFVAIFEFNTKHGIWKGLGNGPFQYDRVFFRIRQWKSSCKSPTQHCLRALGQRFTLAGAAEATN